MKSYLNSRNIILYMAPGISSTQDRETVAYHFRRSFETWYGILMKPKELRDVVAVRDGLTEIISAASRERHLSARAEGCLVFSAGNYSSDILDTIRAYARENASLSVILEGSYFDFLGREWIQNAKKDYEF